MHSPWGDVSAQSKTKKNCKPHLSTKMKRTLAKPRTSETIPKLCLFYTHGGRGFDGNLFSLKDHNTPHPDYHEKKKKKKCPPEPGKAFGEASSCQLSPPAPANNSGETDGLPPPFSLSLPQSHGVFPYRADTFTQRLVAQIPLTDPRKCKL